MAFAAGDSCLLASAFVTPALSDPGIIADGTTDFLTFGITNAATLAVWNSGQEYVGPLTQLRRVAAPSDVTIVGKYVQVTGKSAYFRGVVIASLKIEINTTGGTGAETDCVYVLGNGGHYFLATTASVAEVTG